MQIIVVIAWRNIWRHPGRSGVLLAAVIAGLWAGVLTIGAMNAMMKQRMNYLIENEITHAQVHHPDFLADGYSWNSIPRHEAIVEWLTSESKVESFAARTITDGMLQSPVKTSGVRIRGVEVEAERSTTTFHENMVEGEYLDADLRNAVIMGKALADEHNMHVGHRVVMTFEDVNNELVSAAFNIAGFFESASTDYDRRNVFARADDLSEILAGQTVYHEIAILLVDEQHADAVAAALNDNFPEIEAQTWRELSPELSMIVEMGGFMLYLIILIIMIALAFGILNTMLMSLFERMREIGMLLSIGMSRQRVFSMILLESVILALSGAIGGMLLAYLSIIYLAETGINLERFAAGAAELGYDHILYPFLAPSEYAAILGIVIGVTMLASICPAVKAIRVNPLEAARDN